MTGYQDTGDADLYVQRRNSGTRGDTLVPNNGVPQPPTNLQEFPDTVPQPRGAQVIQTAGISPDLAMSLGGGTRRVASASYVNSAGLEGENSAERAVSRGPAGLRAGAPQIFGANVAPYMNSTGTPNSKRGVRPESYGLLLCRFRYSFRHEIASSDAGNLSAVGDVVVGGNRVS